MKVILMSHIEKLGNKGEVVTVKRGFARNYLIPRNMAIYATPQNMKHLSSIQNKVAEEEEKLIAELKKLDAKIRNQRLVFVRKVDENESMFGSVSEIDIVQELSACDITIQKAMVMLEKHIKILGESVVQIRLHKDIVSELVVLVEKEAKEASPEVPEAAPVVPEAAPVVPEEPVQPEPELPSVEEAVEPETEEIAQDEEEI